MRAALFLLTLNLLLGCAGDKADDGVAGAPRSRPVGSGDAAPAAANEPARADDRTVPQPSKTAADPAAEYREITVPAGTLLPLELTSSVGSDSSSVEDPVRATLRRPITIGGTRVLPAGSVVTGHVTEAVRSARVKGRGRVAFRFSRIDLPGEGGQMPIRTATIARVAPATKKQDAAKIGAGAAGGAIVGGLIGGGDGAAKGAVVGGGAGTAVVLTTRGKEIRLGPGAPLSVRLTAPLTVRIPVR
jgi:hypothetical protein